MTRNITTAEMNGDGAKTFGEPTAVVFYAGGERSEVTIAIIRGSGGGNPGVKVTYTRPAAIEASEDAVAEARPVNPRIAVDERAVSAALNAKTRLPRGGKGVIVEPGDEDAEDGALYFYGQLNMASAQAIVIGIATALTVEPKAAAPKVKRGYAAMVAGRARAA